MKNTVWNIIAGIALFGFGFWFTMTCLLAL